MRIKYNKGITPEAMAEHFLRYIRENDLIVGTVNMYIQVYDEQMKPVEFRNDKEYLVLSPTEKGKRVYDDDVVNTRRNRLKVV